MNIKKVINKQTEILKEMQNAGFNVVNCGNCSNVILQKIGDNGKIKCCSCKAVFSRRALSLLDICPRAERDGGSARRWRCPSRPHPSLGGVRPGAVPLDEIVADVPLRLASRALSGHAARPCNRIIACS